MRLRIYVTTRLRGLEPTWLRGYVAYAYVATRLRDYVATWLRGYEATWLRGYTATWLFRAGIKDEAFSIFFSLVVNNENN